jgi:predicted nuclease of restriction endonuclease-like (RecB) superfamily
MAKRKTKATSLAKISGQNKPSAALPVGYANLLTSLKARVRAAQLRAAISVNRELIRLYWDIGKIIVEAQKAKGYGKQVVERLAEDLQKEFPGTAGFSPQNVWFMRSFYLAWQAVPQKLSQAVREFKTAILSQPVRELAASAPPAPISELPWGHNRLLLTKLETPAVRLWYAHKAVEHGWSRAVLTTNAQRPIQLRFPHDPQRRARTRPRTGFA